MKTSLPILRASSSSFQNHFGASSFTRGGGLLKKAAGIPTRSRPVSRRAACESSPPLVSLRGTKGMQTAFGRRRRRRKRRKRHRRFEMTMQRTQVVATSDVQSLLGTHQPREQRSTRRADAHHRETTREEGSKKCPVVPPGKRERGPFNTCVSTFSKWTEEDEWKDN